MKLRNALALGMGGAALALLMIEPSLAQSPTVEAAPAATAAAPSRSSSSSTALCADKITVCR